MDYLRILYLTMLTNQGDLNLMGTQLEVRMNIKARNILNRTK